MFVLSGSCAIGFLFMLLLRLSTVLEFPSNLLVSVNPPLCCFRGSPFPAPVALAGAGPEQGEGLGSGLNS